MTTKLKTHLATAAALTAIVATAGAANAASISQSININQQSTDFTESFDVDAFDASLGTLNEIVITLEATIAGDVFAENTGPSDTDVTLGLNGNFGLMVGGLNAGDLVTLASEEQFLPGFDGTIDFAGDSGVTLEDLSDTDSVITTLTDGDDLFALLSGGPGTVAAEFNAAGMSAFNGPGNVFNGATTVASGFVTVEYIFEPTTTAVPEPGTLFGLGLAMGAGLFAKKRADKNA